MIFVDGRNRERDLFLYLIILEIFLQIYTSKYAQKEHLQKKFIQNFP